MVSVLTKGQRDLVELYQRLIKWCLIPTSLTQYLKVRIKSKWSNPGKEVEPSPILLVL